MIIYKDILDQNQEFFCDESFPHTFEDDFLIKIDAKFIDKPVDDLAQLKMGSNPSAEGEEEQLEEGAAGSEKVVDMCFLHKLEENKFLSSGKILKKYLNGYMKAIINKLNEIDDTEAQSKAFKDAAKAKGNQRLAKLLKDSGDDLTVYVGENFELPEEKEVDGKKYWDVKQGIVLGVWHDSGMALSMYVLKHGTLGEKV